jgi:hypothetical protein
MNIIGEPVSLDELQTEIKMFETINNLSTAEFLTYFKAAQKINEIEHADEWFLLASILESNETND